MSTKNPNQRRHYVIARDRDSAQPVLDTLLQNGLKRENALFLKTLYELEGQKPEELAFIYGPGFGQHPDWAYLYQQIRILVGLGAIVKPNPLRRLIDQPDEPTGGLWDEIAKGHTREQLRVQPPKIDLGYSASPAKYKQYYLGGPLHARRRYEDKDPRLTALFMAFTDDYLEYSPLVLGDQITFWIHQEDWPERQRLVREFLLLPFEV
ncbi:hypothetical protein GCM10010149_87970 [Nonomuraea roseoviolacea subsp. roseoviolacea]|uniref:hypothetical protein n=1 Tax=Nonomuraea roseoviolacea TaxID=103837 RepID=UPI0031D0C9D0